MNSPEVHTNGNFPSAHAGEQLTHQQIRSARLAGLQALSEAGVTSLRSKDAHKLQSNIVRGISNTESVNQITGEHPVVDIPIEDQGQTEHINVHTRVN